MILDILDKVLIFMFVAVIVELAIYGILLFIKVALSMYHPAEERHEPVIVDLCPTGYALYKAWIFPTPELDGYRPIDFYAAAPMNAFYAHVETCEICQKSWQQSDKLRQQGE